MRKMLVIASREYLASVQSKAFVISLVIMPVLMGGSVLLQTLLKDAGGKKQRSFALIDRTPGGILVPKIEQAKKAEGRVGDTIQAFTPDRNDPGQIDDLRLDLSRRVEQGELAGVVEIGPEVYPSRRSRRRLAAAALLPLAGQTGPFPAAYYQQISLASFWRSGEIFGLIWGKGAIRYQTNNAAHDDFPRWVAATVTEVVHKERSRLAGVPLATVKGITRPVPLEFKGLSQTTAGGKVTEASNLNRFAALFVPMGLMMLMFMVLMIGATPLMQGIVEEKMQRIAEVLLGSVRPFELMMGKLLGMVGVSLTLVAVYLGGGFWGLHHFGYAKYLPVDLVAWFLVFQVLSVLMYGSLFIAVGAACTDTKETQTMLMPVMLLACVPMFVVGPVLHNPDSAFAEGMSLFPFATPMVMITRQAIPPGVPLWQPLLGVVFVLLTTLLCVYAAGRIFRVGILMQGKGAKFSDMIRWVFRG
jgi:ABC-2 type transport system permease protein